MSDPQSSESEESAPISMTIFSTKLVVPSHPRDGLRPAVLLHLHLNMLDGDDHLSTATVPVAFSLCQGV